MNMTGLRHSVRGSSLRSASGSDFHSILRVEQAALHPAFGVLGFCCSAGSGIDCGGGHSVDSFSEGAEREHGQEGQGDQDQRDAGDHADELRSVGGQRADGLRRLALLGQRAGQRQHEDDRQEPAEDHGQARVRCCTTRC